MSLQSRIGDLIVAIGADIKDIKTRLAAREAAGGGGGTSTVTGKTMAFTGATVSSTVGSSINGLSNLVLGAGTYLVKIVIIWQSSNTANGAGFWFQADANVVESIGHGMTHTTGVTATTGIADGQSVLNTFDLMEGRAFRGNNSPGPLNGVDTINADIVTQVEGVLRLSGNGNFTTWGVVDAGSVTVQTGSYVTIKKIA